MDIGSVGDRKAGKFSFKVIRLTGPDASSSCKNSIANKSAARRILWYETPFPSTPHSLPTGTGISKSYYPLDGAGKSMLADVCFVNSPFSLHVVLSAILPL